MQGNDTTFLAPSGDANNQQSRAFAFLATQTRRVNGGETRFCIARRGWEGIDDAMIQGLGECVGKCRRRRGRANDCEDMVYGNKDPESYLALCVCQ
jgi:hypothetical protein